MSGYDCYINCIGFESCKESKIFCSDYGNCYVNDINNILKVECTDKYSC